MRFSLGILMVILMVGCKGQDGGHSSPSVLFKTWSSPDTFDENDIPVTTTLTIAGAIGGPATATFQWTDQMSSNSMICECPAEISGAERSGTYLFGSCVQRGTHNGSCAGLNGATGTFTCDGQTLHFSSSPSTTWTAQ